MNDPNDVPESVALGFVDRINRGDVDGLAALMTEDHELRNFDEPPQHGRESVADAWRGYARSFPRYRIVTRQIAVNGHDVAILGHTTGSHLGLRDDEEARLTLIWVARVDGGRVASWTLIEDTPRNRAAHNLGL
jgi:ketosteroid isomerase-like protein